jgi:hypothetical protein
MNVGQAAEAYRMYERHEEGALKIVLDMRAW